MEAAKQVLALVAGREDALWSALEAAADALLSVEGAGAQPALYCHVVVEAVAGLEQRLGAAGRTRRVFALETAVMRLAAAARCAPSEVEDTARLPSSDWRFFRSSFVRVMEHFVVLTSPQPTDARKSAMSAATRLGVLLSSIWLLENRRDNSEKAKGLLEASASLLQRHSDVRHLASGPLFLLAMTSLGEDGTKARSLELFRTAAAVTASRDSLTEVDDPFRGVFGYWFAVALSQNGLVHEAATMLRRCVRSNYDPVACLTLAALLHLRELDFREAADELQRAMEIDFAQSVSMFDYAVLLGRMGNFVGQFQMLEYYCESSRTSESAVENTKKRQRSELVDTFGSFPTKEATVVDASKLFDMIPSPLSRATMKMVHLHLALAAMENENWLVSKRYFEEFIAEPGDDIPNSHGVLSDECDVARDYIYVLLQSHHFTLALSRADAFLTRPGADIDVSSDQSAASVAMIHLYKADALLSLERVASCHEYLSDIVAPLVAKLLASASRAAHSRGHSKVCDEIVHSHTQLLNNLAVITVCQKGVDAGIALLRQALLEYPGSLTLKFNLVLLLWRSAQKEAACTLWIEARGWNLQMAMEDLPDEKELDRALKMSTLSEQASSAARATLVSEHVSDLQGDRGVSEQQLVSLDTLILSHWRKVRNAKAVESSLLYVQYLETLAQK